MVEEDGVEREGVERKVVKLHRPSTSYFTRQMKTNDIENTPTIRKVHAGYMHATPVKRRGDLRAEPEISSKQSAIERIFHNLHLMQRLRQWVD